MPGAAGDHLSFYVDVACWKLDQQLKAEIGGWKWEEDRFLTFFEHLNPNGFEFQPWNFGVVWAILLKQFELGIYHLQIK